MNFQAIIGIEIHLELLTKSKMFSSGQSSYNLSPNSNLSVNDLGLPGTLPQVNQKAVEQAIKVAHVLNCTIDPLLIFDRKNYFYSDLPKGYQITQNFYPLGKNGYLDISCNGISKRIRIQRLHLEEDTAKQLHFDDYSLLDYTRAGVPLVEIVTEPDFNSGQEVASYLEKIRSLVAFIGASDAKMEEGSLRCDVNISLRPFGEEKFGTRVEIKNINSISNVAKAIEYEITRQSNLLYSNQLVLQETRRYDDNLKSTVFMRLKTDSIDYKYFCEPNIVPIKLDKSFIDETIASIGLLPDQILKEYLELGLSEIDSNILIFNRNLRSFFEECIKLTKHYKSICNLLLSDISAFLNKNNKTIDQTLIKPHHLANVADALNNGEVSSKHVKLIIEQMLLHGKNLDLILKENNIALINDIEILKGYINQIIKENPEAVASIKSGKDNVYQFLVAQIMKLTRGQANPVLTIRLLKETIK